MCSVQRTKALAAMPIGVPGWPGFAFSTASAARKRMVLTQSSSNLSFPPGTRPCDRSAATVAVLASVAALDSSMENLLHGEPLAARGQRDGNHRFPVRRPPLAGAGLYSRQHPTI